MVRWINFLKVPSLKSPLYVKYISEAASKVSIALAISSIVYFLIGISSTLISNLDA